MKKTRLALFFSFFFIFAFASVFPQNSNQLANLKVDDVFASLTSSKVTSGDFVQEKTSAKLSKPLVSSGNFIFCGKGIVWAAQKPFKTSTVITESSIIQTGLNGKKQVIDGSSNEVFKSVAQALSSLFTGDKSQLETYFEILSFSSDSSSWKMALAPKDKTISSAIGKIELGGKASGKKASLDSMRIEQSASSSTNYSFSSQVYAKELSREQEKYFE